jgi:hypothetical protein
LNSEFEKPDFENIEDDDFFTIDQGHLFRIYYGIDEGIQFVDMKTSVSIKPESQTPEDEDETKIIEEFNLQESGAKDVLLNYKNDKDFDLYTLTYSCPSKKNTFLVDVEFILPPFKSVQFSFQIRCGKYPPKGFALSNSMATSTTPDIVHF